MRRRLSLVLLLALTSVSPASGHGRSADPGVGSEPSAEDTADDALDVISSRYPTPHDNYLVVICRSDRAAGLANDTALGAFVRYMRVLKSNLAVVVAPAGYSSDPTYVAYFDGRTPLGVAAFEASESRPTDAVVAKAYVRVSGPIAKQKRQPAYKAAFVPIDDGAEIAALRIVGWK